MRYIKIITIVTLLLINIFIYSEYKLIKYVLSEGGVSLLKTASYNIGLTIGQSNIGILRGNNYKVYIGFWSPKTSNFSFIESKEGKKEFVRKYSFRLYQNYPNPFKESTRIYYSIPKSGRVRMELIDVNGRLKGVLLDEYKEAGIYYIDLVERGKNLGSGVYFYRLIMGENVKGKKLLKIN